jgi:hypothetical protein
MHCYEQVQKPEKCVMIQELHGPCYQSSTCHAALPCYSMPSLPSFLLTATSSCCWVLLLLTAVAAAAVSSRQHHTTWLITTASCAVRNSTKGAIPYMLLLLDVVGAFHQSI